MTKVCTLSGDARRAMAASCCGWHRFGAGKALQSHGKSSKNYLTDSKNVSTCLIPPSHQRQTDCSQLSNLQSRMSVANLSLLVLPHFLSFSRIHLQSLHLRSCACACAQTSPRCHWCDQRSNLFSWAWLLHTFGIISIHLRGHVEAFIFNHILTAYYMNSFTVFIWHLVVNRVAFRHSQCRLCGGFSSARLGFAGEDPRVLDAGLPGLLRASSQWYQKISQWLVACWGEQPWGHWMKLARVFICDKSDAAGCDRHH